MSGQYSNLSVNVIPYLLFLPIPKIKIFLIHYLLKFYIQISKTFIANPNGKKDNTRFQTSPHNQIFKISNYCRNQRQFSVKERKTDVGPTCKQHLDLYERKNEKKRSFGDGRWDIHHWQSQTWICPFQISERNQRLWSWTVTEIARYEGWPTLVRYVF